MIYINTIIFIQRNYINQNDYIIQLDIIDIIKNNWYNNSSMQPIVSSTPMAFITYRGTSPKPTSWQTTFCIHPRTPPGGRQALPGNDCAGGAELFLCHRQELRAVFPKYCRLGWRKELVSCSLARIGPGNQQNQASLQCIKYNNKFYMYNHHN